MNVIALIVKQGDPHMVDECKGCILWKTNCFYRKIDGCPCKTCLVKVMCIKRCHDLDMQGERVESR